MKQIIGLSVLVVALIGVLFFISSLNVYTYKKGGFSIWFPGEPKEMNQQVPIYATPRNLSIYAYTKAKTVYTVLHFDLTSYERNNYTPESFLDEGTLDSFSRFDGETIKKEPITLNGYKGMEVAGSMLKGEMEVLIRTRAYLVEGRLYALMVMGMADDVRDADTDRFFDSFKLLD